MNNLHKAADRLRKGWCKSHLYKDDGGDRFCAVGALAAELINLAPVAEPIEFEVGDKELYERLHQEFEIWTHGAYEEAGRSKEMKILAKVIYEQHPERYDGYESFKDLVVWTDENGEKLISTSGVVYSFNDSRETELEDVLEVFDKAAVLMEELSELTDEELDSVLGI